MLKDPRDVTVGNNSNAYVTSYTCNSVVVLESGGRQGRQLISSNDGLSGPTGLHFDKSNKSVCVKSCFRAKVLLYIVGANRKPAISCKYLILGKYLFYTKLNQGI